MGRASQSSEDQSSEDAARAAFREGSQAASEERWADSERAFARAYELSGTASALFNRAVALRALGRHLEARDAFTALLDEELAPPVREQTEQLRAESAARVATLRLEGMGDPDDELTVQLDGEDVADDGARPLEIETDEGRRALRVEQTGFEPFTWHGVLAPGATESVSVSLVPLPTPEPVAPAEPGGSVFEEAWFWTVIGIVVVGAATGVGLALTFDAQLVAESPVVIEL